MNLNGASDPSQQMFCLKFDKLQSALQMFKTNLK